MNQIVISRIFEQNVPLETAFVIFKKNNKFTVHRTTQNLAN